MKNENEIVSVPNNIFVAIRGLRRHQPVAAFTMITSTAPTMITSSVHDPSLMRDQRK